MSLRVLMAHNYYLSSGGEDESFRTEVGLLRDRGHHVEEYVEHNQRVAQLGAARSAVRTVWSHQTYREVRRRLRAGGFDVVHVQNFFPLISPAIYYAARAEGVPVVQALRNYRLFCLNSLFLRDGRICEDCLGRVPWPGVVHACYRSSRAASAAVATMVTAHRLLRTWVDRVDVYVALTQFAREKFIAGGLSPDRITVKPNFLEPDPGPGDGKGAYALFVGRLSAEKGVDTLLRAWRRLGSSMPLKIVGEGPLERAVAEAAHALPGVTWLGKQPSERVLDLMKDARLLILPSTCYEGFPRVIVEAFASGLPVIASELGGMAAIVEQGRTGLHVRPGDAHQLAEQVEWIWCRPADLTRMRRAARAEFEAKYTAEENYRVLLRIYEAAAERARERGRSRVLPRSRQRVTGRAAASGPRHADGSSARGNRESRES